MSKSELVSKFAKQGYTEIRDIGEAINLGASKRTAAIVFEVFHKGKSVYFFRREMDEFDVQETVTTLLAKPKIYSIIVFNNGPTRIK